MLAWVDPSLQEVKSGKLIILHSLMTGDIVDSEPGVSSRRVFSF